MKRAELKKNHVVVVSTPTYDKVYLVDHVGHEKVAVTLIGGRSAGGTTWVPGYSETQIDLADGGPWHIIGDIVIGRLVRSLAEWARQEWALVQSTTESRDLAQAEANRLASILEKQEHAAYIADLKAKKEASSAETYDADSTLPLGWYWCVRDWPRNRDLMTATGPRGELMARSPSGRPYRAGVIGDEPFVEAVERALAAKDKVST
jgi:hypothetical protein